MRASSSIGLTILLLGCGDPVPAADGNGSGPDPANRCGNGVVEQGEFCDAGGANNNIVPNACRLDCTLPYCGDGVIDDTEECDLGDQNGGDACTQDCISLVDDATTTDVEASTSTDATTGTDASSSSGDPTTAETTAAETSAEDTTAGTSTGGASG